jgi:hypothetical protein
LIPFDIDKKDDSSFHSDQISNLFSELVSKVHEHACVDLEPRPKWAHLILPTTDDLADDPIDLRRTRSQFEEAPHALISIELVNPIHCYMVLTFDPQAYVETKGNPHCKTSMNEGDFDLLPSNPIKWIDTDISLVHLHHHIHVYIYIFNKDFTEKNLTHL